MTALGAETSKDVAPAARMGFPRALVSKIFASAQAFLRHPRAREVVRWCLPALILATVLRVILTVQMPYAFFHDDAPDFLTTADRLIHEHKWELHEKKTFLVPLLFTLPFALPWPAMLTIPFAQHLLGLGVILMIGALCRLWLRSWKIFIIPLTLLAAINPYFLWYEHTLMAETTYVFCTLLVALCATLYAKRQTIERFVALCVSLVLEAGARPEGKLLFGFALFLLVLLHFKEWRNTWRRAAVLLGIALVTHLATKTSQAGLLLYTSVARMTPPHLSCAPGFEPYIAQIRSDLQRRWADDFASPRARDRKAISSAVQRYLAENPAVLGANDRRSSNAFCLKLAKETCLRNIHALPAWVLHKFRSVATEAPSGLLDRHWLFEEQRSAFAGKQAREEDSENADKADEAEAAKPDGTFSRTVRLSRGLTGETLTTRSSMNAFIDAHYQEIGWFNSLAEEWRKAVTAVRLPDLYKKISDGRVILIPGLPLYFVLAAAGLVAIALRRSELQRYHIAWGLTLIAFLFTIILTAPAKPRFRFVFEPFWFLYIAALFDVLFSALRRLARR